MAEGDHAEFFGRDAQLIDRAVVHDHFAERVVHDHQLKQADAAFVPRVVADFAAAALIDLFALEICKTNCLAIFSNACKFRGGISFS